MEPHFLGKYVRENKDVRAILASGRSVAGLS
jgi:hypothetical protein